MANDKINEGVNKLKDKVAELNKKLKDVAETATLVGMEKRDEIEEKIKEAKGNVAAAQEQYSRAAEKSKTKVSSELLKAQMTVTGVKENLQAKKNAHDKAMLEEYIGGMLEYAEDCQTLAALLIGEAELATLEAAAATIECEEKFGK